MRIFNTTEEHYDKCNKSFSKKDNLKRHIKSVHEMQKEPQLEKEQDTKYKSYSFVKLRAVILQIFHKTFYFHCRYG